MKHILTNQVVQDHRGVKNFWAKKYPHRIQTTKSYRA